MQRVEEGDCAALSDRDKYDLVMRIADEDLNIRELGGELLVQMMKYALATRYYSPRIETFRQLAVQSVASIDANATLDQHEPIVVVEIANGQEVENQKWRRLARGVSEVEDAIAEALKFDSVGTRSGDHCGQFVINTVYPFDHPYHCSVDTYGMEESSSVCNNGIRVIVYSDLHSKQFLEVHKKLKELICSPGTGGRVQYYFRHFDHASTHTSEQSMTNPLPLQGYGVELIIKNLEYKQMDDSLLKYKEKKKKEKKQDKEDASSSSSQDAKDEVNQDIEGQLKDLGVQIAQYAMDEHSKNNSKSGLVVLQDLVQNFPSYLHRVLKIKPNRDIQKDIVLNQSELGSGSKLMINGIELDLEQLSIFNLLDIVGSEFRWMNKMRSKLHLPSEFVKESILRSLQVTQPAAPLRYDPFLDDEEKTLVTAFINDIEKDDHYQNFPKDLKFMLAPPYFGQMRFSKRNVFQAIYLSDLSQKSSLEMVSAALATYQRGMPAQFGFLFFDSVSLQHHIDNIRLTKQSSTPVLVDISLEGDSLERASNNGISLSAEGYECDRDSATTAFSVAFQFMLSHPQYKRQILPFVFQLVRSTVKSLQPQSVRNVFASVTGRDLEQIMSQNSEFLDVCSKTGQIAIRTGLRKAAPSMLLNGRMFTENDARVQDLINTGIFSFEYAVVKDLIKNDKITDSDEHLPRKILDQFDGVLKRYNPNAQQHSPIFKSILAPDNLRDVPFLTSPRSTQGMDYIFNYFFVLDLHNVAARHLLSRAIDWLSESRSSTRSRIAIIPSRGDDDSAISQAIMDALKVGNWVTVKQTLNAIEQSVAAANDNKHLVTREQILGRLPSENRLTNNHEGLMNLSLYRTTMLRALDFTQHEVQAQQFIILNGQQIALPTDEDLNEFALEDFGTLERVEHARIERICEQFNAHTDFLNIDPDMQTSEWRSNVLLGITSTLGVLHSQGGHRTLLSSEDINFERVAMTFNQASGSLPHVTSIVDPLDEKAQKIMAFTRVLAEHFGLPVTTILNPPLTVEGVPKIQKRWYRFVMDPELQFHESNGSLIEPRAQFDAIPADQNILTMNMHVPETWLIESIYAVEDLDNINLANMIEYSGKESLYARYHLENIIVTGSCNELQGRGSTRGLQLILGDRLHPRLQDTLVMANYGYFQLKACPNVWKMQLAPGRHAQVFQISEYASSSSYDQRQPSQLTLPANGTSATIILDRFDGPFVHLHVEKRKGMENADLFGPADAVENNKSTSGNIWDRVKSVLGGNDESKEEKQRDVINVFSIASGHMYERLMKIMILSVVKNTKRKPVKVSECVHIFYDNLSTAF